jgi:hypothetical protein
MKKTIWTAIYIAIASQIAFDWMPGALSGSLVLLCLYLAADQWGIFEAY